MLSAQGLILNLLAHGWPVTPRWVEDIERSWPTFMIRVENGMLRIFAFSRRPQQTNDNGLRLPALGGFRSHFWYDMADWRDNISRGSTDCIVLQDTDGVLRIPPFPEDWHG